MQLSDKETPRVGVVYIRASYSNKHLNNPTACPNSKIIKESKVTKTSHKKKDELKGFTIISRYFSNRQNEEFRKRIVI